MANYIPDPNAAHFDPMMLTTNVIGKAYRAVILYNKTIGKKGFAKTPLIQTGYKSEQPNILPFNGSDSAYKGWRNPDDRDYPFIRYNRNVVLPDASDYVFEQPQRESRKSNNSSQRSDTRSQPPKPRDNPDPLAQADTPGGINGMEPQDSGERTFGNTTRRDTGNEVYTYETARVRSVTQDFQRDRIILVDLDYADDDEQSQGRFYKQLVLPFVPLNLQYSPESNWVAIPTMGRNNPHYHWTGSEDTLSFEIDWFSEQNSREDVIRNCRWLESLSKADGYKSAPHRLKLIWGRDDKLFQFDEWIVQNASYSLSQFQDSYRDPRDRSNIISIGLLPQQAKQTVTLKRVTKLNLRTEEIVGNLGLQR